MENITGDLLESIDVLDLSAWCHVLSVDIGESFPPTISTDIRKRKEVEGSRLVISAFEYSASLKRSRILDKYKTIINLWWGTQSFKFHPSIFISLNLSFSLSLALYPIYIDHFSTADFPLKYHGPSGRTWSLFAKDLVSLLYELQWFGKYSGIVSLWFLQNLKYRVDIS